MFEKWTKKATNTAVETVKENLNDKLETYSGIIKIGLTLSVIAFGSKKLNDHIPKAHTQQAVTQPQPIIINNYYDRGYSNGGRQGQRYQKH